MKTNLIQQLLIMSKRHKRNNRQAQPQKHSSNTDATDTNVTDNKLIVKTKLVSPTISAKKVIPKTFLLKERGTLILSERVQQQIDYLLGKFPSNEWSGVFVFSLLKGDLKDVSTLILQGEYVFLHDIGSGMFTESTYGRETMQLFEEFPDAAPDEEKMRLGFIHSHHTMSAGFSSVDLEELADSADTNLYFVSIIVSSTSRYVAKLAFLADMTVAKCWIHKNVDDSQVTSEVKETEKVLVTADLNIYSHAIIPEQLSTLIDNRIKQISERKTEEKKKCLTEHPVEDDSYYRQNGNIRDYYFQDSRFTHSMLNQPPTNFNSGPASLNFLSDNLLHLMPRNINVSEAAAIVNEYQLKVAEGIVVALLILEADYYDNLPDNLRELYETINIHVSHMSEEEVVLPEISIREFADDVLEGIELDLGSTGEMGADIIEDIATAVPNLIDYQNIPMTAVRCYVLTMIGFRYLTNQNISIGITVAMRRFMTTFLQVFKFHIEQSPVFQR